MKTKFSKLLLLPICFLTISCSTHRYGAVFYDDAYEWIKKSFQEDNQVVDYSSDESTPSNRTFLINDISSFNEVFIEDSPFKADFNKNIYVVYTFCAIYRKKYILIELSLKSNCLNATYTVENRFLSFGSGNACQPYQRWFVIKLNKLNIDFVNVVYG